MPQIKNEGGLFDESAKIYPFVGAQPNMSEMYWKFPSGSTVSFSHLEHEKNIYDWQGAQIPLICFDELTHFTKKQFFYMLSRNRSTCGIKPYIRATTNPDKKSWVRAFIDWWIYPKGHPLAGLPMPERSGVVRWFYIENDIVYWSDTKEEIVHKDPKSFTFIPAKLTDNKILMSKDPGYLANLMALPKVERAKLLDGNWDAEEKPGELFRKEWFTPIATVPGRIKKVIRYWDRAASESESADWTVGVKLAQLYNNQFVVMDMVRFRGTPGKVEERIRNVAGLDGPNVTIGLSIDPGQAGLVENAHMTSKLAGYTVKSVKETGDKVTRAGPVSSQCEAGNVMLIDGKWNEEFISELESFPSTDSSSHDDVVDALSGAFNLIIDNRTGEFTDSMSDFDIKEEMRW
jgi:predicted phage terminase large subunit-like protein